MAHVPKPPRRDVAEQTASNLRLLIALILEDGLDHAQSITNLYSVANVARGSQDVATLAAAINVVERWRERLLDSEESLD